MGLDIYLSPIARAEANKKHYAIWNDDQPEATKEEIAAWEAQYPYVPREDAKSERHPEHYFNRRYLRSSYNDGGFNRVVPQMLARPSDLYWIFEPMGREWDGDEGILTREDLPKLAESKKRAEEVAAALVEVDPLRAITVHANLFTAPPTASSDEAVDIYRAEYERNKDHDFGWYSNLKGEFFHKDPPTIVAAILGRDALGSPAVHLIYRPTDGAEWYQQAAEIVAEFCDEAISLIERDGSCEMSWSG